MHRGVYAVGRPELTRHGRWMAAVLSVGEGAVLSHRSAGELWGLLPTATGEVHVSVSGSQGRRRHDLVVHRRVTLSPEELTRRDRIPVTVPACTLVDLAADLSTGSASTSGVRSASVSRSHAARGLARLERAVNEADGLRLIDPEQLRTELERMPRRRGVGVLRAVLDRHTFVLTDSELERRFLPLARRAGLGLPATGVEVSGFRVDFFWAELGLIVETDGLAYHRTPAQQARDRLRDQTHTAAGLTCLRFTHAQVRFEGQRVESTLRAVAARLSDLA